MADPPPGARAIRRHLRRHRSALPRTFRASLAIGAGLVGLYLALQALLLAVDPGLGADLLRLFLLTMLAGREAALFAVYQGATPVPVAWAAGAAILDDLATLFLAAPAAWLVTNRLRRFAPLDGLLRSFEKALGDHRRAVDRGGAVALALFLWLPGWGTGPSLGVAMGVLAGISAPRLLALLSVSCVGVNLFWAVSLAGAARAAPDHGAWAFLPLGVVALLVALGVATAVRHRHRRYVLDYPLPAALGPDHALRLASWGFERHRGGLRLDARRLSAEGGPSHDHLAQAHWTGELLLLPSMTPADAGRLAALGVTGIHDLALLPPDLLDQALAAPAGTPTTRWIQEARDAVAAAEAAKARRIP